MALEPPLDWLIEAHLWEQRSMFALVRQPFQWLLVLTGLYWLQLGLRTVSFLRIGQNNSHSCDHGGEDEEVGTHITCLVTFHTDWSCESKLSRAELHWLFLHSLSWLVTNLYRWLTSEFRVGPY